MKLLNLEYKTSANLDSIIDKLIDPILETIIANDLNYYPIYRNKIRIFKECIKQLQETTWY